MRQQHLSFPREVPDWTPPTPPELRPGELVGLDFEYTPGVNPTKDEPFSVSAWSLDRRAGWYLPWNHDRGGNLQKETVVRWLRNEMRGRPFFSVNAKAEVHQFHNLGIDPDSIDLQPRDVVFNAALLDENRFSGNNLRDLSIEYLSQEERKMQLDISPERYRESHAGEVADYCVNDSMLHARLHEVTYPMILAEGLDRVLQLENDCILATVEMERNGAIIDRAKLELWDYQIDEKINTLFMDTYKEIGLGVNPDKEKEMIKLFQVLNLPRPKAFDEEVNDYVESFSEEALQTVNHPIVQRVLQLRKWKSVKSKYITKYLRAIDSSNVLRFTLHQLRSDSTGQDRGTVVGRYSCGGDPPGAPKRNVNIQQVMKAEDQIEQMGADFVIRELFVPQRGLICGASDASQLQFRLFAHYAAVLGHPRTALAYRDDPWVDFHTMVTRIMKPEILCSSGWPAGCKCEACKAIKAERKHQKHNNFGKLFGMGRPKLARRVGHPCYCPINWYEKDENGRWLHHFSDNSEHLDGCEARFANDIFSEYDREFPEASELMKAASNRARDVGFVKTILGRRRRFPGGMKLHKALNAFIIGSEGDVFKTKLKMFYHARKSLGITLRMPVHDEIVYDAQPEEDKKVQIDDFMNTQDFQLRVNLLWKTGYGNNWKEANLA